MKNLLKLFLAPAFLLTTVAWAAQPAERTVLINQGRYLVEDVIGCADCHSPRNERGEYIKEKWLQGAPLAFAPTVPMPAWAPEAPAIAGLPPAMTEAQMASFMQNGLKPDGAKPRPPMPEFRLNAADARAVAAYLKSLGK